MDEWEAPLEAHTHLLNGPEGGLLCLPVGAGKRGARAHNDTTDFYKAVLFIPKYLMNMLLK